MQFYKSIWKTSRLTVPHNQGQPCKYPKYNIATQKKEDFKNNNTLITSTGPRVIISQS